MSSSPEEIEVILTETFAEATADGEFDPEVDSFMRDEVIPVLQEYSPVDTGEFRDSWEVTKATGGVGQVGSNSDIANLMEYGSIHNPAYAPLAKAIEYFAQ